MKLLNKRILRISKSALLCSCFLAVSLSWAQSPKVGAPGQPVLVSSDRYLIKIVDRTLSFRDLIFQTRNLKAIGCVFDDSLVVEYFGKDFIREMEQFTKKFPEGNESVRSYLHAQEPLLKKIRHFFKMLRYAEDQKGKITPDLIKAIRQSVRENNCSRDILYKEGLKTNFINLLQLELYVRTRYGGQLKSIRNFSTIKPSIDLFIESLDKQFAHEYYW